MKNNNQPLVYIIIINWNGLDDTIECLKSLNKISYKNYKIVLVDNNSKDNQAEKLEKQFPYVKLIKNTENTGFCIANNQGMELALKDKADYVLLLNNDTTVTPNFLDILIDYSEKHPKVGITTPKINYYYQQNVVWCMGGNISKYTGLCRLIGKGKQSSQYSKIIEPDFASGCALLVKQEVFKKIGLLDPVYFAYYEDADFSYRTRMAGYKIVVLPKSIILHKKSASAGIKKSQKISPLQAYYLSRNMIIFYDHNINKKVKSFVIPIFTLLFFIKNILSINKKVIINFYKGLQDGISKTKMCTM